MKTFENYEFIYIDEVDSTNSFVRSKTGTYPDKEFVVAIADYQTAGRGQRGNTWVSESKKNLLFSLACRPSFIEADQQFILSQIISLSIKEELEHYARHFSIKWPNDIYWKEKKIGGILIENDLSGKQIVQSIIGVGLNINQIDFPEDLPDPISLVLATGQYREQKVILLGILRRFERYYHKLEEGLPNHIAEMYKRSLLRKRGYYLFQDKVGMFGARIHHVEPDGHLILQDTEKRLRSYAFKEVTYIFDSENDSLSRELPKQF